MAENLVNFVEGMQIVNRDLFATYQQRAEQVFAVPQWPLPNNTQRTVAHPAIVIFQGNV